MNGEEMKFEPCPWCGSTNIETELDDALGRKWGFAVCCDCSTRGPDVRTGYDEGSQAAWRVEAVAMWNTRAPINRPSPEAGESGKQPFERYPALASWIERLANANMDLPLGDWMVFVGALNMTLARLEAELAEARKERDGARSQAAPVVDETELRPSVLAFARLMEAKLRANDHKSGWSGEDFFDLFDRLIEETSELHNALCRHAKRLSWGDSWVMEDTKAWVGEEAADVANFAMMIADVCAALEADDGLKRAHAASLAPAVPEGCETGWLIERYSSRSQSLRAQWLKAELFGWDEEKAAWTTDASEALRLSRKVDAEALIAALGWTEARATEHQWLPARQALASLSPAKDEESGQ